jgi:predicted Zn-dependent peptidase
MEYLQHQLPSGLTLVAQHMPGVESAAMTLLVPSGSATDPDGRLGSATVLSDLIIRGAGERDSRALTDYLDLLGLQRSSSASVYHVRLSAAGLADRVIEGLSVYADMVQQAHLKPSDFESSRQLAIQALDGVEDEPRHKLTIQLRKQHLPDPLGRNTMGERRELLALTCDKIAADYHARFQPQDAILAVAGNIDFDALTGRVQSLFATWPSSPAAAIKLQATPRQYTHETQESEQTHIGIAWDSVPESHPDTYAVRLAAEVFGGGMSGRLFTEIREKRALCYSVGVGYAALKELGYMSGYAGTSNDRAQGTLDCFMSELQRLRGGITQAELDRAKVALKSSLIMQGESTSARAGAIAHDYFIRKRIRPVDEIKGEIDAVTLARVNDCLAANAAGPFTVVTVGPKPLCVNCEVQQER